MASLAAKLTKITNRQRAKAGTTFIVSTKYPPPAVRPATVNHAGISGGKDSTVLAIWMVKESGYPRESLEFSFCDTDNESPITYRYLDYLEDALQIGITRIKPWKGFKELAKWKKRFPSARARFCTEFLKIIPTTAYLDHLLKTCKHLVLHSGVRAAESDARKLLPPESFDEGLGAWVKRPMLKWSISDVWAYHEKHGIKPNPLYRLGMSRVGCFPCVMSNKPEMRRISFLFPQVIDKLRQDEKDIGENRASADSPWQGSSFFHAKTVPASQRSTKWVRGKDGKEFSIVTIDDVVRWSRTARGGRDQEFQFDETTELQALAAKLVADLDLSTFTADYDKLPGELPSTDHTRSCPSSMGLCE